jgi:hypothetical protein
MNHEKPNPSVEGTSETQARRLRYVKQHPQVALPIRISYQRNKVQRIATEAIPFGVLPCLPWWYEEPARYLRRRWLLSAMAWVAANM